MFDTVVFDTLSLAFEEADLLPETGNLLCLRAEACSLTTRRAPARRLVTRLRAATWVAAASAILSAT